MLLRIAFLASIAGFLYGYDLGLIGGAMAGISQAFGITDTATRELIVAGAKAGAFFGTFLGGALMLRFGRRRAIAALGVLFATGPVIMATAGFGGTHGPGALIAGRVVIGLGIGASAIAVPAYLAELAPPKTRGSIVAIYEVMLTLGMLSSLLVDALLAATLGPWAWRLMVGLPCVPGLVLAASLLVLPESPRWLVMTGDLEGALATLHRVQDAGAKKKAKRCSRAAEAARERAERELEELRGSVELDREAVKLRRQRLSRQATPDPALPPVQEAGAAAAGAAAAAPELAAAATAVAEVRVGTGSKDAAAASAQADADACTQPLAGHDPGREPWFVQTLFWMVADIYAVARGPERRAFVLAVVLAVFDQASASTSVINYASTLLSQEMHVAAHSALLMPAAIAATKVFGVAVSAAIVDRVGRRPPLVVGGMLSALALLGAAGAVAAHSAAGLLACMCVFLLGYSIGWAALFWVVVSELFSMTAKSPGSSAATSALFLTGALVDLVFLSLYEACGPWAFVIFAAVAAAGAGFVWACIPETAGRTLLEVQELLQQPPRRGAATLTAAPAPPEVALVQQAEAAAPKDSPAQEQA